MTAPKESFFYEDTPADRVEAVRIKIAYERTPTAEIQHRISQVRDREGLSYEEVYRRVWALLTDHLVMPKKLRL